jgi:hypothetical protein
MPQCYAPLCIIQPQVHRHSLEEHPALLPRNLRRGMPNIAQIDPYQVQNISVLRRPNAQQARTLLEKVGRQVQPILRRRCAGSFWLATLAWHVSPCAIGMLGPRHHGCIDATATSACRKWNVPQLSEFYPRAGLLVRSALHVNVLVRLQRMYESQNEQLHTCEDVPKLRAAGAEHRRRGRRHPGNQDPPAAPR